LRTRLRRIASSLVPPHTTGLSEKRMAALGMGGVYCAVTRWILHAA
jgi:hypothetical protein